MVVREVSDDLITGYTDNMKNIMIPIGDSNVGFSTSM